MQPAGDHPFQVGQGDAFERPHVRRVERIRLADAGRGQRFADRLEVRFAVVLHQRLEEAHAEHLAFAFVDARGEVLVDVVAEVVAVRGTSGRRASS